jgi:uncharacterized protein (DUF362 family)
MGAVYEEFERELAAWQRRYAGQPRREMLQLFLLALEREELVSVGYREAAIVRRLATMPLSAEVRDLIHHALVWVWKDEEMHAIYMRGVLLQFGSRRLRLAALARQMAGAVGGWSASVQHHARWSDAPFSRACAGALTRLGSVLGKVPRDVREHLRYGPFRNFCLFNVDAEDTAELCWQRLVDLAAAVPDLPPGLADAFQRIRDDERRHARIFRILAAALDEDDRLMPGETAATLLVKIAEVGTSFLAQSHRAAQGADHPLGGGGDVFVVEGHAVAEKLPLFGKLLDDAGLAQQLAERAAHLRKPVGEMSVAIKATFILGYHHRDRSPLTDPVLLDALGRRLRELGCADVALVEERNIYDRFFQNRSVAAVAQYFGIASPHFRIVDAAVEQVPHVYARGLGQDSVSRTWKEADFRITFPKVRSHPIQLALLSVANVGGIGARWDTMIFAERQAQLETGIMMLLDAFPPHFALLDAYECVPDGLMGMMGSGSPRCPKRLYAGADALAVDTVAGRHIGMKNPDESSYLRAARHWFGAACSALPRVIGPDTPIRGWRSPYETDLSTLMSFLAYPVYEFGSGRGALFVPEMDERAFPPIGRPRGLLRCLRRLVQTLVGLRHGRA